MIIKMITTRLFFTIHFLACLLILSVTYYLEYVLKLDPCPLCILERILLMFTVIVSGLAILHNPRRLGQKLYSLFNSGFLLLGLGLTLRHLYLQSLTQDKIPECIPGFDYLIKNFPLSEVIRLSLKGSGECAQIGLRFMGLSLAQWSFMAFVFLLIWNLAPIVGVLKLKVEK